MRKLKPQDFIQDIQTCKASIDETFKMWSCAKTAAASAVFEKNIPLNFEEFGFVKKTIIGSIKHLYDGHSDKLIVSTDKNEQWLCVSCEDYSDFVNTRYMFEGLVGPEGAHGPRGIDLTREFLIINIVKIINE